MRAATSLGGILIAGVLIAGCSSAPEAVPPTPPAPSPTEESPTAQADPLADFYAQELDWRECGGAECTKVQVPMDYDDPAGQTVELSLTKVPATGESIGALLVNPGGPGGSAFDYAKAADFIVSPEIRESFDIVGVDPRGVGKSQPVRCLSDAQIDEIFASDGTPDTPDEGRELVEDSRLIAEACERNAPELWRHMGTVSVARDMDIVRASLDEPVLNYLGKSYGTAIGARYAQLFPSFVGRMVLDGVLPTGLDQREVSFGQAVGFENSVRDFAADCADSGDCPFPGDQQAVLTELRAFLDSLDSAPLPTGDGRELTQSLGSYAVLSFLYFPDGDYPRLRAALSEAVQQGDGSALLALVDERTNRSSDGRYLDNSTDAFYAVSCTDLPFDGDEGQAMRLADEWQAQAPTFGPALAWGLLACADWPVGGELEGGSEPIRASGAPPILVLSTTGDPATPYEWGVDLARSLEDGHLITWDAFNHTAYREGSACVDEAVDAYLLAGELPDGDLSCS